MGFINLYHSVFCHFKIILQSTKCAKMTFSKPILSESVHTACIAIGDLTWKQMSVYTQSGSNLSDSDLNLNFCESVLFKYINYYRATLNSWRFEDSTYLSVFHDPERLLAFI